MKTTKIHRFGQNQQLFTQTIKFGSFPQLSCRKLQKCLISWKKKKWKKSSTWPKLATFAQTTMFQCFPQRFSYKLQKVLISWKIMKNHRFSQNYQLFAQTIMFSAKSCKTCLLASNNSGLGPVSRKSRKAIRKIPTCLSFKAGLFVCCKGNKNKDNCKVSCLQTP